MRIKQAQTHGFAISPAREILPFQRGRFFHHPWPFLGLAGVLSFQGTNSLVHRSFPTRSFNFSHYKKEKKKRIRSHRLPTCSQARTPRPCSAHVCRSARARTRCSPEHPEPFPFPSGALGLLALSQLFFSQWQARKDDRTCVCSQKTGLNWFRGEKIELCVFFFFLAFSQRPGSI